MTRNDYEKETWLVSSMIIRPTDDSRTVGRAVRAAIDTWFREGSKVTGKIGLCCRIQVQTTLMVLERSAGRWEVFVVRDENENLECAAHWNRPSGASPWLGTGTTDEARAALYVAIDLARLWGLLPR